MYGGVLIMTTYKLVVIPHRQPQIRTTVHWPGELRDTSADERYAPFEHLPKEYLQVRRDFSFPQGCFFGHENYALSIFCCGMINRRVKSESVVENRTNTCFYFPGFVV